MATLRERLSAWAADNDTELIFFDPPEHFDDAIVGLVHGNSQELAVLYDEAKVVAAMGQDWTDEDVTEWFEFNTLGTYVGEATPRFLIRPSEVTDEPKT